MMDINLIRKDPDFFRNNLARRRDKEKEKILDEVIESDKNWRDALQKLESLKSQKNTITKEIAEKKRSNMDCEKEISVMKTVSGEIKELEEKVEKYKRTLDDGLMRLPNLLHESVPYGKDDTENVELRRVGKIPEFNFEPRSHFEILERLGLIDQERASKVAGTGFFYFRDELVMLDYALMRYGMDFLSKRGYTVIEPPYMIRRKPYEGVTDLADFEDVIYKLENDDLHLIATSEHPMAAMYMNEVILKDDLPIKLCGISPCFRKEIGTHGKYTRGMFRMHQFNKIEQFIFSLPEDSWKFHEELQENSEKMLQELGLPYRVVNICTGDIGIVAAKKYDNEVYMADGNYREVGSNSNCTEYQARRLNIKYRETLGAQPKGYVHTLNNTGIATSRVIIGIIENYQEKDGTIRVPEILRPYMNGMEKIEKRKKS